MDPGCAPESAADPYPIGPVGEHAHAAARKQARCGPRHARIGAKCCVRTDKPVPGSRINDEPTGKKANALIEINWQIQLIVIGQVVLAMVLGGLIGFERELANKPAGFRTHTLVAGAAALFMALAVTAPDYLHAHGNVQVDPLRVAAAIVTGVSFLGAGTIFRSTSDDGKIGGLTTAATIWLSAAVGIAVSVGQMIVAIGVTMIALLVLRGLTRLDRGHHPR